MSLNWNWSDKIGELTYSNNIPGEEGDCSLSIYRGNALAIFVYEYNDSKEREFYTVHAFFSDKASMKRTLGLDKKSENYGEQELLVSWKKLKQLKLFKSKCKELGVKYTDIVSAFSEAFDDFEIKIE